MKCGPGRSVRLSNAAQPLRDMSMHRRNPEREPGLLVALAVGPGHARALWQAFEPAAHAAGLALRVPMLWPGAPAMAARQAVQEARRSSGWSGSRWALLGHGTSAAPAQELALAERDGLDALLLSDSPWYAWPWLRTGACAAPFGAPAALGSGQLARGLWDLPIGVWVSAGDLEPLPPQAFAQGGRGTRGLHRVQRARRWVQALRAEAALWGRACDVSLSMLPCAGLDMRGCVQAGLAEEVLGYLRCLGPRREAG